MSNTENQTPLDPVVAAGATSHTGGFADAGASSSASATAPVTGTISAPQSSGFAPSTSLALGSAGVPFGYSGGVFGVGVPSGGMQSSPNVPAPGASIDPSTGKPYSAGMTRAELEAARAAALSGREQAARQLAGPGLATGAPPGETPGRELPGGWGPTAVLPAPGTSAQAPASIYEDVNTVLHKVGATAYAALPATLKEALSNNPEHLDKGKQPEGMPSSKRSSVAVLFDNAKKQTTEVINAIREETKSAPPMEGNSNRRASLKGGPEGRRTSQDQPTIFSQVKELIQEAYNGSEPTKVTGPAALKTSMPSDEPLGAKPGEHVSGVGALPGKSTETGVAVLPDEKTASGSGSRSIPSHENQGLLPGEVTAGVAALSVAKDQAPVVETAGLHAPQTSGSASGTSAEVPRSTETSASASGSYNGLAPPLPQTTLGTGASEGATDVTALPGISAGHSAASSTLTTPAKADDHSSSLTAPSMNERTDSFASTTAIRHGHVGEAKQSNSSPLATTTPAVATVAETPTPSAETPAEADTTSPLPVGAAPTTVADVAEPTPAPATPAKTKATDSAIADSPVNKSSPLPTKTHTTSTASPVTKTAAVDDGHRRTSSASSGNGKKKAGFMAKLKGEMKVISGKIGGDEAKVQAGERLKHGE